MAIVKYKNQSGVTYAYESVSEWDPVKKQSRPKRKYLGRVDPETGEIISTAGKRGRPKKKGTTQDAPLEKGVDYKSLYEKCCASLKKSEADVKRLEQENERLVILSQQLEDVLSSICRQAAPFIKDN